MAECGWRQEPDGFRYLEIDFRGDDAGERTAVLRSAIAFAREASGRVPMLVRWESGGLDVMWFKQVKDANRALGHLDLRAAFVGLGGRGNAIAGMLNLRVGHERARHFPDDATAFRWLRDGA